MEFRAEVMGVLVELVLALVGLLAALAVRFVHRATAHVAAETQDLKDRAAADLLDRALRRLDDIATRVVSSIEQTTAASLRQAIKDGRGDRKELLALASHAYVEIIRTLEPDVRNLLRDQLGDLSAYIKSTIEAKVLELKRMDVGLEPLAPAAVVEGPGPSS